MSKENWRVIDHPILGPPPERSSVTFTFNGTEFPAYEGEMLAAALLAHGIRSLRPSGPDGVPRGLYCAIGHCFECQVVVDGRAGVRACLTPVRAGMDVSSMPAFADPRNPIRSAS